MSDYQPRPQFMPFHTRNQRWACIVAHRRAGKTVACINEILTRALATNKQNARYAYIAPYYKQSKTIAWDYLKRYSEQIRVKSNEAELWVELFNGSRIYLFGADNPDSLRGLYLDGCVLDEFADMKPSIWGAVIRPLLTDRKGWAIFIGTPKGHNAFYDIWREADASDDWFSLMLRASTSGLLDPAEIQDARKTMSDDQYEQEFECSFEAAIVGSYYGKLISQAEREGRICSVPYQAGVEVHTFWDVGRDGLPIWFYQMVGREPRIIDYYEAVDGTLEEAVKAVKERGYNYGNHVLPHDAAHNSIRTGTRMADQIKDLGLRNVCTLPNEPREDGIELVKQLIPRLYFDSTKCYQGIEALKNYQRKWDEERKVFSTTPLHNWASHAADALRYLAVWLKMEEGKKPYTLLQPVGHFAMGMRDY
jgi:phage terminase large subunit